MLGQFITDHRDPILEKAAELIRSRAAPAPSDQELAGLPLFLAQLSAQLRRREGLSADVGGEIGPTAADRGEHLYDLGLGTGQIVHDYGSICQSIMTVASTEHAAVPTDEYKLLNMCLDEAIAEALTRHAVAGARTRDQERDRVEAEHLGGLVHELRNTLGAVTVAFASMKRTGLPAQGSHTGELIERNLSRLNILIDRSLAAARLHAAPELNLETFTLQELANEVEWPAASEAEARGLRLVMDIEQPGAQLRADMQLVVSALSNLVQNALKFTHPGGTVTVRGRVERERVFFDVQDECGGLPKGAVERLFQPFVQGARDREGVGLGLAIARRAVEAHGGTVNVYDTPGVGCVFTIELPHR